jgi:hypothetical protein
MSDIRCIAVVRKNNSEEIRVSVATHADYSVVDMRVFAAPRSSRGEPIPTKAGICVAKAKLPELILALQAAEREMSR